MPFQRQSEPVTPTPGVYRMTYISVVNGRKMKPRKISARPK